MQKTCLDIPVLAKDLLCVLELAWLDATCNLRLVYVQVSGLLRRFPDLVGKGSPRGVMRATHPVFLKLAL